MCLKIASNGLAQQYESQVEKGQSEEELGAWQGRLGLGFGQHVALNAAYLHERNA